VVFPRRAIAWNRTVNLCTRCDLTRASDKLIALSAIASEFRRIWLSADDQYLVGLWKSQFPDALLWQGATTTYSRQREYRAPSWSLASIDGPIPMRATEQQPGHRYHIFTEALVAETTTAANNPTGKVTGGYLHLLVLFANATWEKRKYRMELIEVS
jgi:hypothetical protein